MTFHDYSFDSLKAAGTRLLARSHIAGPNLADAIRVCRIIAPTGWSFTVGPWIPAGLVPEQIFRVYIEALQAVSAQPCDINLSINASELHYRRDLTEGLLELASDTGTVIHFDAEHPDTAQPTLRLLELMQARYRNIGCTIPARWPKSVNGVERIIEWGIPVRIVKGQWSLPQDAPVDVCQSFLGLIELFLNGTQCVAVATHDRALAYKALSLLTARNVPCELEQMLGLPPCPEEITKYLNVPRRLYVPYGAPYLPYHIRDVWHRQAIALWMVRDFFMSGGKKIRRIHKERDGKDGGLNAPLP